jgi:hypothetical protein
MDASGARKSFNVVSFPYLELMTGEGWIVEGSEMVEFVVLVCGKGSVGIWSLRVLNTT